MGEQDRPEQSRDGAGITEIEHESDQGLLRGVLHPSGVESFYGIPYAAAPVGELRWCRPRPHEGWSGMRDATRPGPTCQRAHLNPFPAIPEPLLPGEESLNLTVHAPARTAIPTHRRLLPVLVWFHGGGFTAGSNAVSWYNTTRFAEAGIVHVIVNYRLGLEGHLALPDAESNRGFADQVAALRWVADNIHSFGGDPARVTIAGQSAGGSSVLALLGSPATERLVSQGAAFSPAALRGAGDGQRRAQWLRLLLGGHRPTRARLAALPVTQLDRLTSRLLSLRPFGVTLHPHADDDLLPEGPDGAAISPRALNTPLLIGCTSEEFDGFDAGRSIPAPRTVARIFLTGTGTTRRQRKAFFAAHPGLGRDVPVGRAVTDGMIRSEVVRVLEARRAAGYADSTWAYEYRWPGTHLAAHCADVPLWHGDAHAETAEALYGPYPPERLAAGMHASLVDFVRSGAPGWPAWGDERMLRVWGRNSSAGPARVIDGTLTSLPPQEARLERDAFADLRRVWVD